VPSYVEVTSLDSGHTALVRLDQRGPMNGDALLALSPMAWAQLGLPMSGTAPVRVRRVNPPEQERALLRTGQSAPLRMDTPPGLLAALKRKLGVEPPVGDLPLTVKPTAIAAAAPPKPLPVPKPPVSKPPMRMPAQAPKPVPKPPVAAAVPDEPPAVRPAATTSRVFLQIGAFAQRGNAEAAARKTGGSLVRAGNLWRVRSGPFSAGTEADSALAKARRAGYAGTRTVRE
jgi:rare lipoprotein A